MSENKTNQESSLYYFYSEGCGWCKRANPIVDELIKEGKDILKLDLGVADNQKLLEEIKKEYDIKCGTPLFVNAETGHKICGFREKDIVEKWVSGDEIPEPPRPKGPPPPPPQDFENKEQIEEWSKNYTKWAEENKHMPNIPPAEQMLARLKQQRTAMLQQQQGGDARIANIERKLDALMKHLGVPPVLPIPPQGFQPPANIKNEKDKTNQIKTTGKVETKGK